MKKQILSYALMLMTAFSASSQSINSAIKKTNDSTQPQNLSQKNPDKNIATINNSVQSKALVPLLPDISFDEFPINHNEHITTDGTYYYTINGGNFSTGQINKFDLTGTLIQTYPIQIDGRGLSYNKADGFLYASLYAKSIVRIDNLALGTFTTIFPIGMQNDQASFAISNDGTKYYDFFAGTLLVHDFITGAVVNTITGLSYGPGNFGGEEAVAVDSLYIFTWDATIKTVWKYDMAGTLMQTLVLDSGENGMSLARAGNYLFVSHDGNYAVGRWYGYLIDSINSVSVLNTCFGDSTAFSVSSSLSLLGAAWNFGDTASGINNTSYILNPLHLFTQPGTYNVEVIRYFLSYTDTASLSVTINPLPVINLGTDTSFCTGGSYQLNAGGGFASYYWQDGSIDSVFSATTAGTYYVMVSQAGCFATDSIDLSTTLCALPVVNFYSSDTSFCEKQCIDFTDLSTNNPTSWQWFFPGAQPDTSTSQNPTSVCYNSYGSFNVTLITCNAVGCDTLVLTNFIVEYQAPTVLISQSNDTLYSTVSSPSYQWFSVDSGIIAGATNNYFVTTAVGNYFVVITDSNGCEGSSNVIAITTGISSLTTNEGIVIAPNPFTNEITISFENQNVKQTSVCIKNVLGQEVFTNSQKLIANSFTLDLSFLQNGIYFLEIRNDDSYQVIKILKE